MGIIYNVDTLDKGTVHVPGETECDATRFHHAVSYTARNLEVINCLFLEFSINIFRPWLTVGN